MRGGPVTAGMRAPLRPLNAEEAADLESAVATFLEPATA
jgi:dihydrodipicolinate synthase/N-acetylneuraminate lyase